MTSTDQAIPACGTAQRADHWPYIEAVCRALVSCGIRVSELTLPESEPPCRQARLVLRPMADAFASNVPETATASWDESNGWQITVSHEDLVSQFAEGTNVLLTPHGFAAWAVITLTQPGQADGNDHTRRPHDPRVSDPEFEARLMTYSQTVVNLP